MNRRDFLKKALVFGLTLPIAAQIRHAKKKGFSFGGWFHSTDKGWQFEVVEDTRWPCWMLDMTRPAALMFKVEPLSDKQIERIYRQTRKYFELGVPE